MGRWRRLARFQGDTGNVEGEIEALTKLLNAAGEDPVVRAQLAKLLSVNGRGAEAAAHLRALAQADPANPEGWRRLARFCQEAGDAEGEIAALQDRLDACGLDDAAEARLVRLLSESGRGGEAAAQLRRLAQANPQDAEGWRRLARLHQLSEDVEGEIAALKDRLAACGPDAGASARLAKLLVDNGRGAEAGAHLQALAEADPANPENWRQLIRLQQQLGSVDGEIEAHKGRLKTCGFDAGSNSRLLKLLTENGRKAEATAHLRALAEAEPGNAEGWSRLARLHADLGEVEGEIAALQDMLGARGPDASVSARLIRLLTGAGRGAEATAHLRTLAKADPADTEGWRRLARFCQEAGDAEGEIAALQDRLDACGLDDAAEARLVRLLSESGRGGEAAAQLRRLAQANPQDAEGWRRLARLHQLSEDVEGEIAALKDRLAACGPDAGASARLLKLLTENGRKAEAAAHLRALAEAEPGNPEGWRQLVRHHQQAGDVDGEIAALRDGLDACGFDAASSARLVRLLTDAKRTADAVAHLRALAEADPSDPEGWRRLARLHADLADAESEIAALQKVLDAAPGDSAAHTRCARLLSETGRSVEAAVHLRALAEANPRDVDGWRRLERHQSDLNDVAGEVAALQDRLAGCGPDAGASTRLVKLLVDSERGAEAAAHLQALAEADPANPEGWRQLIRLQQQLGSVDGEIEAHQARLSDCGFDAGSSARLLKLLTENGRGAEAAAHLRALAEAEPGDAERWSRLTRLHATLGDPEGEIAALQDMLAARGADPGASARLVRLLTGAGRGAEAAAHLRALAKTDPADPEGWRRLARFCQETRDVEGEISALDGLLATTGADKETLEHLIRILMDSGRKPEAAVRLRALAEADPASPEGWRRLARLHAELEDPDAEIGALRDWLQACGPTPTASARLFRLLMETDRSLEAAALLRGQAEADPGNVDGWRRLARLQSELGDAEGEIAALQNLLKACPSDADSSARLIRLLADNGREAESIAQLRSLAEANPTNVELWRRLVRVHADRNDREGEITAIEDMLRHSGEDLDARYHLAKLLFEAGQSPRAGIHQRILAEASPQDVEGWTRLAKLYEECGDREGEIAALADQVKFTGPDAVACRRLSILLLEAGRGREAVAPVRALAEADPQNGEAWERLVQLHAQLGDVEGERAALEDQLKHAKLDSGATARLVKLTTARGGRDASWEATVAAYEELLVRAKDQTGVRIAYGQALADRKLPEAGDQFRMVLEMDPDNAQARLELARWAQRSGGLDEAAQAFQNVLVATPDDILSILGLADILERQGKIEEAFALYARAAKAAPDNAKVFRFRASFLSRQAVIDTERASELAPDSDSLAKKLRSVQHKHDALTERFTDQRRPQQSRRRPAPWPSQAHQFDDFEALVRRYVLAGIERKVLVTRSSKAVTMGSCFAEHVARRLQLRGIDAFYVQVSEDVNSTFANRCLMDWAAGVRNEYAEQLDDKFGPERRDEIEANLRACDLYIFSLGVAPCFFKDEGGEFVLFRRSGIGAHFRTTTVPENVENLSHIILRLRELNPDVKISADRLASIVGRDAGVRLGGGRRLRVQVGPAAVRRGPPGPGPGRPLLAVVRDRPLAERPPHRHEPARVRRQRRRQSSRVGLAAGPRHSTVPGISRR